MTDKPAPLTALAAGAIRACVAHFRIFTAAALACLAAQAAIYFLLHPKVGNFAGDAIIGPILVTIVYVFVATNAAEETYRIARPWERILERVWAVVVIDFITELIFIVALMGAGGGVVSALLSVTVMLMYATLVFADVFATVEPDVRLLLVIPLAFVRSISLAWQKGNISRVLLILALWLILNAIQNGLIALLDHWHVRDAIFWGDAPLTIIGIVPIAAFTALVYFDCVSRERLSSDKRE